MEDKDTLQETSERRISDAVDRLQAIYGKYPIDWEEIDRVLYHVGMPTHKFLEFRERMQSGRWLNGRSPAWLTSDEVETMTGKHSAAFLHKIRMESGMNPYDDKLRGPTVTILHKMACKQGIKLLDSCK